MVEVFGSGSRFKPGDEVFGSAHPDRGSTWAEYSILKEGEIALKPKRFSWEEAAAVPISALTAYQSLFEHGGLIIPDQEITHRSKKQLRSVQQSGC